MTCLKRALLSVLLAIVGSALGAEFSAEKIQEYASTVRMSREAKSYVDELPPEAVTQIVDQLDFTRDGGGRNTFIFCFSCMKAYQNQSQGTPQNEDYVFGRLTDFVRSAIDKGDVGAGGWALNSLAASDHPKVLELARELLHSDDELTRKNAKRLLEGHERRAREKAQADPENAAEHLMERQGTLPTQSKSSKPANQDRRDDLGRARNIGVLVALVGLALLGCLILVRIRVREHGSRHD